MRPWPTIDVLLPVYNESSLILAKLENLERVEYPEGQLRFIVVDGGSTDDTCAIVQRWSLTSSRPVLLIHAAAGKVRQLRTALHASDADWVLVTDADARLAPSALVDLARVAQAGDVQAVGTAIEPFTAHPIDRWHWRLSNWLRRLEARCGSAGVVVGPCYLVRRSVLEALDDEVAVDDVFVSCQVALAGGRIGMAATTVTELRAPLTLGELMAHKHRKSLGYLREAFRFLPHVRAMQGVARHAYVARLALLLLLPWPAIGLMLALGYAVATYGATALVVAVAGTAAMAALMHSRTRIASAVALIAFLPVVGAALALAAISYPFVRSTDRYPRVGVGTLGESS